MKRISETIRQIRAAAGLSQEGLAKKLGVSFTSVNRWESGRTRPGLTVVRKLQRLAARLSPSDTITLPKTPRRPTYCAYAFFAGGGGLHLGFECDDIEILLATDIAVASEATHKANWPTLPFLRKDIRRIEADELVTMAGGRRPDIVFGGPPCQGFSTLGDKLSADPKNDLFEAYARLVGELAPQTVILENVKAMTTMYGGRHAENAVRSFQRLGYTVYLEILNAADYGVPQIRERAIFIATKKASPFQFPSATHGDEKPLRPYEVVGDWIMDLAKPRADAPNHLILDHSATVIERYRRIPEGGRLPPPSQLPKSIRRKNFGNTYKRLSRKRPSLTMVPGNNAFPVHPTLNRSLTPREAARLQTFPDTHIFIGSRREQCILVGNAVPVKLAEAIRVELLRHLRGNTAASEGALPKVMACNDSDAAKGVGGTLQLGKVHELPSREGFVDLFSGAGGFTLGFARAGWRPLLSVDCNKHVRDTHASAFPAVPFLLGDLSNTRVLDAIETQIDGQPVGIVVGGPPCQGFSIFGKRRFVNTRGYKPATDPRNKLVFAFLDTVRRLKPRWFVMENVKGFTSLDGGMFLQSVLEAFAAIGYGTAEARVLNAADYGVPQLRERLLIIGNRTGHIIPWPKRKFFDSPEDWQRPYRTVGEVITDLARDDAGDRVTCHHPMKHKPLLVERYTYIPEGGRLNVAELPDRLRRGYRTDEVKNYSHVFRRLDRNRPSFTMVPGHNAFPIHPWLHRALTVREAARIQTFPDEIEFKGPRQEQCIQVGNAFPPMLAEVIANNIRKAERNNWMPGKVPSSAKYALIESDTPSGRSSA
jgi:DNA (cytosine-5)-methyltransferase 1